MQNKRTILPVATALGMFTAALAATMPAGWQTVTPENTCTARHETTAVTVNDILYLIGGRGQKPVEAYDPKTNRWTPMKNPAPMDFHHFSAVAVGGKIAVLGALVGDFPKEQPVADLWWYDPAADK